MSYEHEQIAPSPELDLINSEADRRAAKKFHDDLAHLLEAKGVDVNKVLLQGFDPNRGHSDESLAADGRTIAHFGTMADLLPPKATNFDDPEVLEHAEEAWMVNPLRYALSGGKLRIVSRSKIEQLEHIKDKEDDKKGFGTVIATASDEALAKAANAVDVRDITVVRDVPTHELTSEEFASIQLNPEAAQQLGLPAGEGGIVKIQLSGETHFMSTESSDYGVLVANVLEVESHSQAVTEGLGEEAVEAASEEPEKQEDTPETSEQLAQWLQRLEPVREQTGRIEHDVMQLADLLLQGRVAARELRSRSVAMTHSIENLEADIALLRRDLEVIGEGELGENDKETIEGLREKLTQASAYVTAAKDDHVYERLTRAPYMDDAMFTIELQGFAQGGDFNTLVATLARARSVLVQ